MSKGVVWIKHYVETLRGVVIRHTPEGVLRVYHRFIKIIWIGLVVVILIAGMMGFQSYRADTKLDSAKRADSSGRYGLAQKDLGSINEFAVWPSIKKNIHNEQERNHDFQATQQKITEVQQLLKEHKTQAAEKLLQSIGKGMAGTPSEAQVTQLKNNAQSQVASTSVTRTSPGPSSSGTTSASGGSNGGGTITGSGSSSGGGSQPPGPMTAISVTSFTASATPATASTCTISDSVTFGTDGSGSVTTTWSLVSNKSSSETVNPNTYSFTAAGSKNDSFTFSGTQGLEPGDSYRVSVTITAVSNPSISTTAGPVSISNCAAPPALAAEQESPSMTAITPATPSVYEYQDTIFANECSIQVTTPYSVNASGTVEAIVMVTSGSSIGYTYYDTSGATGFTAAGSTSDTSYFRLPHLPGGGSYSITVKLVEVSSPSTVYTTTAPINSACG